MKFVDLFAGIGGFRTGLEMAGHECVGFAEWDEFARKSYEAIHDTEGEWTARDITEVQAQDVPDHDILCAGMPCQAFSVAGNRRGFEDTRGTLFFDVARIALEKQPKIIWIENVKGLLSHDKGKTLDIIAKTLCDIGYVIDFEILNSKFFNVPQNRERIFIFAYREDTVEQTPWIITDKGVKGKAKHRISAIEGIKTFNFDWPKNNEVTKRLRDILEPEVDEKFYLSEDKTSALVAKLTRETEDGFHAYRDDEKKSSIQGTHVTYEDGHSHALVSAHVPMTTQQTLFDVSQYRKGEGDIREYTEIAPTLAARDYKEPRLIGEMIQTGFVGEQNLQGYRVYDKDGVGATIASGTGGLGGTGVTLVTAEPQMIGHVNVNGHDLLKRVYSTDGISPTLTTMGGGNTEPKIAVQPKINIIGHSGSGGQKGSIYATDGIMSCLTATDYKQPKQIFDVPPALKPLGNINPSGRGMGGEVYDPNNGLSPTVVVGKGEGIKIFDEVRPVLTPDRMNKSQNGRVIKENDEESYTLTAQDVHGVLLSEPTDKIIKIAQLEGSHDQSGRVYDSKGIAPTIMSNSHGDTTGGYTPPKVVVEDIDRAIEKCDSVIKQYEKFYENNGYLPELFNPYNNAEIDEVAPTVTAQCTRINASSTVLKLLKLEGLPIREATKQGYALAEEGDAVNFQFPDSQTRRGRVGKQIAQTLEASGINQGVVEEVHSCSTRTRSYKGTPESLEIRKDSVSNTITSVAKDSYVLKTPKYRIRKLTPKECWLLQSYTPEQFQKAVDAGVSNSQLYKQAGNSVTVNVIFELAKRL